MAGANLKGWNFKGPSLFNIDLTDSILEDANFSNVLFEKVKLLRANIKNTNLGDAEFYKITDLSEEQIKSAKINKKTRLPKE